MTRVYLVQVQEDVRQALRSHGPPDASVSFEEIDEGRLLNGARGREANPDVLVLGETTREPIRIAQRMHAFETDPPVLILSDADRLQLLRRAVQFAPFLGSDVTCLASTDRADIVAAISEAVTRVKLRDAYRSTVDALNARLAQTSARARREVHLDRLLDRVPVGVAAVDHQTCIVYWNPRAALLFGLNERSVIGWPVGAVLNGPGSGRVQALVDACLRGQEPEMETIERLATTGTAEYLDVTATPIEGASGEPGGLLLFQDVTERVRSERQLAEVRSQVLAHEQAVRAALERERDHLQALEVQKDEFLSAIAHDLRTPLTSIRGWSQVLRRHGQRGTLSTDQVREITARIEDGTNRSARMIDELLDLANLQLGRPMVLQRSPVDLVALLQTLVAGHGTVGPVHRITIESEVTELMGMWDGPRLERVFGNLLSNAIKFSPDGGEIAIAIDRIGEWAEVRIADQGVGILPEDLPYIFERFRRGANVTGAVYGTGIGLTTAREIVSRHGGTITAESEPGRGSTFVVRLPLGDADRDAVERPRPD